MKRLNLVGLTCGFLSISSPAFADAEWVWQQFEINCVIPLLSGTTAPLTDWQEVFDRETSRSYVHVGRGLNFLYNQAPETGLQCNLSGFNGDVAKDLMQNFPPEIDGVLFVNLPPEGNEMLQHHRLATQCGELQGAPRFLLMLFQTPGTGFEDEAATHFIAVGELPAGQFDDEELACGES